MKTFKRICLKDYEIGPFKIYRGKEYITSAINDAPSIGPESIKNHVIVFDSYWVPVPIEIFGGEIEFTK